MQEEREQWGSRLGFIFATVGSAIGLGNIWRFPTAVGQSGGGAFLFVYLVIILLVGVPLMIVELTIGRRGKQNIVGTFKEIKPGSPWWLIGSLGVSTGFVVLSFYSVIAGWSTAYIFKFILGQFNNLNAEQTSEAFHSFVSNPITPLFWHMVFIAVTVGIVILGIDKGIEKASKILMPTMFVLLTLLVIRSVTLDNAIEGIRWFIKPEFGMINTGTILNALGQVFFSLSLGMGALMTYGSYLSSKENIPQSAVIISMADLIIAVLAGFIIIPAVFSFGLEPGIGPPLIFITLPLVFESMPLGSIFGALFFLLLTIAAITSSISLLEVVVAYFIEEFQWKRINTSVIMGIVVFILGVPSSLSRGILAENRIFDMPFLDFMDFFASNILLPLTGLLTAIFIGWVWKPENGVLEIQRDAVSFKLQKPWKFIVKFVLPIVLSYILITGLFL